MSDRELLEMAARIAEERGPYCRMCGGRSLIRCKWCENFVVVVRAAAAIGRAMP